MYIRVGIIGCGKVADEYHIPGYVISETGYLHGFYSRTRSSAEKLRLKYIKKMNKRLNKATTEEERDLCRLAMQCEVYDDWEKMLVDVDAVDICTPPSFHMKYAKAAADLGKVIMVEKPAARAYPEVTGVMDSLNKAPFYIFSQMTYNPIFQFGKQIIDSGKIGTLKEIISLRSNPSMTWATGNENYWAPFISGGGALIDLGPHPYSIMRLWLGDEYKLKQVRCVNLETATKSRTIQGKKNYPVKVEDVAELEAFYSAPTGSKIKISMGVYWGNPRRLPKGHIFGFYNQAIGSKGSVRLKKITLGAFIGKKPFFHFHGVYQIDYNDGTHEKITTSMPLSDRGSNLAIKEFINGEKSRNPPWVAEEMMMLINGTYLSHRSQNAVITPQDLQEFAAKYMSSGYTEENYRKYLSELLGLH